MTFTVRYSGATLVASGRYAQAGDSLNGHPLPVTKSQTFLTETYHVTLAGDDLTLDPKSDPRIVLKRVQGA